MTASLDPQRTRRVLFQAMEEVLGEEGLRSVLQAARARADRMPESSDAARDGAWEEAETLPRETMAVSASFIGRLLEALENVYGEQAGRGLALRIGRACFAYGLREYGAGLGLTGSSFRLLPLPSKLRQFGATLEELVNESGQQGLAVEEQEDRLVAHLTGRPFCTGRETNEPVCQLAAGFAEESLYWLSGGKTFHVEEIACAARGDAECTFQIAKTPIA